MSEVHEIDPAVVRTSGCYKNSQWYCPPEYRQKPRLQCLDRQGWPIERIKGRPALNLIRRILWTRKIGWYPKRDSHINWWRVLGLGVCCLSAALVIGVVVLGVGR